MHFLKNKTITYIHIMAIFIMLIFVLLFTTLVIYEEYNDFERESSFLRKSYIEKQKRRVRFNINRVIHYIQYEYDNRDKSMSEELLKKKILNTIEQLYGREENIGYIFIYDYDGIKILDPIYSYDIGSNLLYFKDINGVEILKELIKIARTKSEDFVKYTWKKPNTNYQTMKLSHAKSFRPWRWIIGTGIYLDEVEKLISRDKKKIKKRLIKYVVEIFSLIIILFGIGLMGMVIINRIIHREIDTFSDFFKRASKSYVLIDEEDIYLVRFKKMVHYVNSMVTEIHKRKESLKNMNLKLEKKVEKKTKDLNYLVERQDSFIKHSIHEINTPLAVIMSNIDIFKMKFGKNRYLDKVEAGTKMIANIYDDLSYMVKKDHFLYEKESIDFTDFLESRVLFFEEIAEGNRHQIIMDIEKNIDIYFNEIELQRLIDNNLSNAIKYANPKSNIVIRVKKTLTRILLEFETNSPKIEDITTIFKPFEQVEELQSGFGLGLEIVASICYKNHVSIELLSDDKVTIFRYLFKEGENR